MYRWESYLLDRTRAGHSLASGSTHPVGRDDAAHMNSGVGVHGTLDRTCYTGAEPGVSYIRSSKTQLIVAMHTHNARMPEAQAEKNKLFQRVGSAHDKHKLF